MKTFIFRASLLAAALGAALSAQAVDIFLVSKGTGTNFDPAAYFVQTETIVPGGQVGGYGPLSTLRLETGFSDLIGDLVGVGVYTGVGGTLEFSYTGPPTILNGHSQSSMGSWTATGGTGTYLNATGSGTLAFTTDVSTGDPYKSGTVFAGDVEAVPEPASLCALGVGALGLLRRRKRA